MAEKKPITKEDLAVALAKGGRLQKVLLIRSLGRSKLPDSELSL